MTNAIVLATYTIKFLGDGNPLLIAYTGICSIWIPLNYCVAFNDAFKIPAKVLLLKKISLLGVAGQRMQMSKELKASVASLAPAGIKVGQFSVLERESTPVFVGFVINQIANLLLIL